MSKFYITTPIYYPNGDPHLGTVYTTVLADVLARYHRLRGAPTYLLTGTDEHGTKMAKAATAEGAEPQALADKYSRIFADLWGEFQISNDDFIRTSEPRHKSAVARIVRRMQGSGDIYLGSYKGWYDEGQEQFVTETEAKASEFKSPISGKPLTRYEEPSYFFRLQKYAPQVLAYIEENPRFIVPESRRNEVMSKLRAGVEDLSISRATLKWGIPMPDDPEHVVYVWIDALTNYITALGYESEEATKARSDEGKDHDAASPASLRRCVAPSLFDKFWPADLHLIGKDILWFHAVYWPAMLMSLRLALPRTIAAHGWWTSDGRKMSKSLGNTIDVPRLRDVVSNYSLDALRYYLLRAAPLGSDLDWSDGDFTKSFNELANVVGNCLNRTIKMIGRYREGMVPALSGELEELDRNLIEQTSKLPAAVASAYERLDLQQCAMLPVELARATNGYIDATAPFTLAKDPAKASRLDTVLNLSAQAIRTSLAALLPILPDKAAAGLRQLAIEPNGKLLDDLLVASLPRGHKLGEGMPLFPKVEGK